MGGYTESQGLKLLRLQHALKERALPVGSMHAFWDIIMDIDAVLKGGQALIDDPEELIRMAEEALGRTTRCPNGRCGSG